MKRNRINIKFDAFSWRQILVGSVIRRCIAAVLEAEGVGIPCEINVLITDDNGIQQINNAARQINKPTDVLSFPMFEMIPGQLPEDWADYLDPETGRCPLGDMALSLERAVKQADEFGHTARREIGYLTIHSMLHLLGYDHLDEGPQKAQMRDREEKIAATIFAMSR
ncbi:MAG: rRNA maturation RNase YbeY [Oscillospiraceae bacterium]|nr:rRNA maturation RNase YbeY [Oscillospiraceae bacterium]